MAELNIQTPTDSVLRRHWEAAHSTAAPIPSQPAHDINPAHRDGGGLFGWLKKLFS